MGFRGKRAAGLGVRVRVLGGGEEREARLRRGGGSRR